LKLFWKKNFVGALGVVHTYVVQIEGMTFWLSSKAPYVLKLGLLSRRRKEQWRVGLNFRTIVIPVWGKSDGFTARVICSGSRPRE
jgi:hypothetical protein